MEPKQSEQSKEHRSDPEPLAILAAIAGTIGASISSVNYWRTHHKPIAYRTRATLIERLDRLSAETKYLGTDVDSLEIIFQRASFPEGRTLRLGNGALMTRDEFERYEQIADRVFGHLKRIHKLALKVQVLAFALPYVDKGMTVNATGEALARVDSLIRSRDYSIDDAWRELRAVIDDLGEMIDQLNIDLGRNGR